ncbi:MAG: XRE family transcriptional regulator, partial [Acidobacteria bacterium]
MKRIARLWNRLRDKTYRDAFVWSEIRAGLPFQIRALREKKGWTQAQLADRVGMTQSRISKVED